MFFYFIIFCIYLFSSIIEIYIIRSKKDIFLLYYHFLFFVFLLATLKARGLGTDSDAYERFFLSRRFFNQPSEFEFLFARLNEFVKLTTNSYVLLLAIQSFIIYKLQDCVIRRWSIYPITSLFYMWAINANYLFFVRQIVACYILFYSIFSIADRKFLKFLLLILIASGIHISAVFFIPAYFIWNWTPKKGTYVLFFLFFVIVFPLFFGKVLKAIVITLHFPPIIQQKIEIYFINPTQFSKSLFSLIKGLINQAFLLFILLLDFNKYKKIQKDFVGLFNIAWLGAVIFCSTMQIHNQIARFAYPYMLVYMILLPAIMKVKCKNKKTGGLFLIIILYYLGLRQLTFVLTVAPKESFYFVDSSQKLGYK